MVLPASLTKRLKDIAKREGRTPEAVLQSLLDAYEQQNPKDDPIEDFIGAFDDDVTDLSTSVRQTLQEKFKKENDAST